MALLGAVAAGVSGDFSALARSTGHPECQVRQTLKNLRREGRVERVADAPAAGSPPRGVYGQATERRSVFDALSHVREVWR